MAVSWYEMTSQSAPWDARGATNEDSE